MTKKQKKDWDDIVTQLKSKEYDKIHKLFNVSEGWAYLSYKTKRERIDYSMSWDSIEHICKALLK